MNTLLHLDSSANVKASLSRRLTTEFVEGWLESHPEGKILRRDLGKDPAPSFNPNLLEALASGPNAELKEGPRQALAVSDALVDDLLASDFYVFGVPMYNFTIPGAFKDYIDQVARMGRTWEAGPNGMKGLLTGKKAVVISTRAGDYEAGGPREAWDFHKPYLRKVFAFLGVEDLAYIPVVQNPRHDDPAQLEKARTQMREVLERWKDADAIHEPSLRQTA